MKLFRRADHGSDNGVRIDKRPATEDRGMQAGHTRLKGRSTTGNPEIYCSGEIIAIMGTSDGLTGFTFKGPDKCYHFTSLADGPHPNATQQDAETATSAQAVCQMGDWAWVLNRCGWIGERIGNEWMGTFDTDGG